MRASLGISERRLLKHTVNTSLVKEMVRHQDTNHGDGGRYGGMCGGIVRL